MPDSFMPDQFDITIIGAGVIGLAITSRLSEDHRNILLVEKNGSFGQETSSRNSEVIHAGMYYPTGFLKASFCVEGNKRLYDYCGKHNIPNHRIGKLIVATDHEEAEQLQSIKKQGDENGVEGLAFFGRYEVNRMEPLVNAVEALFSANTGIIDSHALMRSLSITVQNNGVVCAYRSEVTSIKYDGKRYRIEVNGDYFFDTKILINAAGLSADGIAESVGIDIDRAGYRLKYCKGSYFTATPSPKISHLIYPVPTITREGLGIHATIDLGGRVRFGPDVEYVTEINYNLNEAKKIGFHRSIKNYLPCVDVDHLHPDMCGIRPKLQGPGEPYMDFIIQEESDKGYRGLINLIGIESPGLTACMPIADQVASMVAACQ
jgi:L-2-hydroxyglutarate oxidase LhgO